MKIIVYILIPIFSVLLSGFISYFIATHIYKNNEIRTLKLKTLREFVAFRIYINSPKEESFKLVLNKIFIVFSDCNNISMILKKIHNNKDDHSLHEELFKEMLNNLKIPIKDWNIENFNHLIK